MAIRRFAVNEIENVSGGVRRFRERPNSGKHVFVLETPEEMEAFADFLENYYAKDGDWIDEEDGSTMNSKILADDWRTEFKGKNNYLMDYGEDMYTPFMEYYNRNFISTQAPMRS